MFATFKLSDLSLASIGSGVALPASVNLAKAAVGSIGSSKSFSASTPQ